MDFNKFFCMLVDMTDSSIADIARTISYDRSYVSKWYNGKVVPSIESWDEISPKLAAYFSKKMQDHHTLKSRQRTLVSKPSVSHYLINSLSNRCWMMPSRRVFQSLSA